MRSIRLSLTVYFLALLAVALGAASVLVYRTAHKTLLDKQRSTEALVRAQYDERCRAEADRFDKNLLAQAQTLAKLAQLRFDPQGTLRYRRLHLLGLLGMPSSPAGPAAVWLWAAQSRETPVSFELYRRRFAEIRLDEGDLPHHADGEAADYFQIDSTLGNSYRSQSLGRRSFPIDPAAVAPDEVVFWTVRDAVLEPDVPVRLVILKVSPTRSEWGPPQERRDRPEGRHGRGPRPPYPPPLVLVVQCAGESHRLDSALAGFAARRDGEVAELRAETDASLSSLQNFLLGLSLALFLAAVGGCLGLVRLGLAPLRRLSDAVSRVSARDFRLPFHDPRLPSELRPIVARLTDTLGQLKRAFAREKQATADISHELRTPLAALLTTTEIALRKGRSADEYRELLEDCRHSAQQINRAVERLLALARLDAGADTLRPRPVDVAELAGQCSALVRPLAEARGLHLSVKADGDPVVVTDPDKLREVLTNLLHNAIQYNRPGGAVEVSLARSGTGLDLAVRDTGIGIAPEAKPHLFERFWRADPSRGADGLHAGLGLAIVKGYVELMGGTVAVDSTPDSGSTFHVGLPPRPPAVREPAAAP